MVRSEIGWAFRVAPREAGDHPCAFSNTEAAMRPRHHIVRHSTLSLLEAMRALSAVVAGRLAPPAENLPRPPAPQVLARPVGRLLPGLRGSSGGLLPPPSPPLFRAPP